MKYHKYILDDSGTPIVEDDIIKWARWFEESRDKRIVKQEMIGESKVSTVFLGIDHNWLPNGPAILWETMVFGGKLDQECDLCSGNKEQAGAMHAKMVERVKKEGS